MKSAIILLVVITALAGCVRTPTQETRVVDDRPRVAFDVSALDDKPEAYQVRIDGIDFGSLDKYLQGEHTLPLLPGQHSVEVLRGGSTIFTKKVYLGENTSRVIKVVRYD